VEKATRFYLRQNHSATKTSCVTQYSTHTTSTTLTLQNVAKRYNINLSILKKYISFFKKKKELSTGQNAYKPTTLTATENKALYKIMQLAN